MFRKPEMLINGGFEIGDPPESWSPNGTPTITRVADAQEGSVGTYCINIARGDDNDVAVQSGIPTVAGRSYTFSGWFKNVDATSIKVDIYDSSWNLLGSTDSVTDTDWEEQSKVFTAAGVSTAIYIAVVGAAGQIGKFDDFSLKLT